MSLRKPVLSAAATVLAIGMTATACGGSGGDGGGDVDTLTLGYFPNITHAPALVGVENGTFAEALGDVELSSQTFNAGPDAINALFAGEIDATFIGPNPAINGWSRSDGTALRVIAGSTSRGAGLVVRPGIDSVDDLPGTTLSTPQLANTQDVALRWFAQEQGWEVDTEGGGDLSIIPQDNSDIINAFELGEIDGAWVPEPHLSRLLVELDGELLVDEADLWEETGGDFVTTHLIVSADFLESHPDVVEDLLRGHIETVDWINDNSEEAQEAAIAHLGAVSGSGPSPEVVASAFENTVFTVDPIAPSLRGGAEHAEVVGLLDPVDLEGIYVLDPLNRLLDEGSREQVAGL
ncbi:ABC transporter substrate-binding protein [Nocardiopsis sp. L17-MgMaSL7]|uniref:ABC transporter substrate-binding protein n=1 Tax=Nocardiopsis sp. L17-MgMaSL7 TaxID=1938893 RepID=UPI000D713C12|nr:ABC transporter substrate-binding protein [Nocardiopsis sp. L17-MgMaSL7]PWV54770.1 NitT/TauT family transport system substrate-binding protein [Nocardiopsis sp. L17-MgMaSL7]